MNWLELRDFEVRQGDFRLRIPELRLSAGQMVAVLGPNGSGKSTLLSALAGLRNYRGTLLLGGEDLRTIPEKERYRRLSYLPQGGHLGLPFEVFYVVLTGRYPLLSGRRYTEADHRATARLLKLFDLEALGGRLFGELSGGERQRVLLARALNREAPVLLLDEPFNAVDLRHQHLFVRLLRSYVRRKEGLCVTVLHDLGLAVKYFDRFLLLKEGSLRADLGRSELSETLLGEVMGVEVKFVEYGGERLLSIDLSREGGRA